MSEYTPGPWRTSHHGYPTLYQVHAFIEPGIAGLWSPDGNGEQQANARLIAAAPDLLAACKVALEVIAGLEGQQAMADDSHRPRVEAILAAISQAEGGAA